MDESQIAAETPGFAPWRAVWIERLINPVYNGTLLAINMAYSLFMILVDQDIYFKMRTFDYTFVVANIFNFWFIVDLVANMVVLGPKNVWKEKKLHYLELVI